MGGLGDRQRQLRDMLGRLQRGLREFGLQAPGQLDGAGEAMERAERALRGGDLDGATQEETRALEQLRQGAREMAQQMLRQMPSRFGLNDPNGELDPMGRPPQRTDGPDPGVGVKVPDQIDIQRAARSWRSCAGAWASRPGRRWSWSTWSASSRRFETCWHR